MNTPLLLLLAALLFWGGWTGLFVPAVVLGLLLEGSRFLPLRWDFSMKELRRLWDLCVILVLGAFVYLLFSDQPLNPFFSVLQWMPLLLAPMMLAQAFGHAEKMPASVFSLLLRSSKRAEAENVSFNISFAYFGVCLVAASGMNDRSESFYIGLCGLVAWALWPQRARRFSVALWMGLLIFVVGLSHVGAGGLNRLQGVVEGHFMELVSRWVGQDSDPTESRTAIGQIGQLKQSGRIVLRVEAERPPELLRSASYDQFRNTSWYSTRKEFTDLGTGTESGYWKLIPNKTPRQLVTVASYIRKGSGLVPLPLGTAEIDQLPALKLQTNALGTVKTVEAPGLVRYSARYGPGASLDAPPGEIDRDVPEIEKPVLDGIVEELGLRNLSPSAAAQKIERFFAEQFSYTMFLARAPSRAAGGLSPMGEFLTETRTGHCEYSPAPRCCCCGRPAFLRVTRRGSRCRKARARGALSSVTATLTPGRSTSTRLLEAGVTSTPRRQPGEPSKRPPRPRGSGCGTSSPGRGSNSRSGAGWRTARLCKATCCGW